MEQASRYKSIVAIMIIGSLLLAGHLFEHQIINKTYRAKAQNRTLIERTISAPRGNILDREDRLIVVNEPTYELEMIKREISEEMDIGAFCTLLNITPEEYDELIKTATSKRYYRSYIPITFLSNIDPLVFARFQEHLFQFPGFYPKLKNKRNYPYPHAAHVLGYISEVNTHDLEIRGDIYSIGDIRGTSGIEKVYEEDLRGIKGFEYILKDNVGREVEEYNSGSLDKPAVGGEDIRISLDIELQAFGEKLMEHKRGSIVAIEPSTGEILTMISAPSYDPNRLSLGKARNTAFQDLLFDTLNKPFLDRSLQAKYPPGSIFKPILSLIALNEGIWYANKPMKCSGEYDVNKRRGFVQKCRDHPAPYNIQTALQYSCNTYYYQMVRDYIDRYGYNNPGEGLDELMDYLAKFGIGRKLGVDLLNEAEGFRPSAAFYDRRINTREYSWKSTYILSLGIGQGELELTTLQMANLAAIIANRGHYFVPHILKDYTSEKEISNFYTTPNFVGIDSIHFPPVIDGMEQVISSGTGWRAYVPGISVCGKTGTSQNAGEDHSVFFAFAPKDDPKIAIAVYVENAGGGGSLAAPIGGLMIEKYLNGTIRANRESIIANIKTINLTDLP